ncbi:MAG: endonuclease/exonuclease/phosphatase family protein [Antricoccus sp.]
MTDLSVVSFNIRYDSPQDGINRWRRRRQALAQVVAAFNADIVGLQEVQAQQRRYLHKHLGQPLGWYGVGRSDGNQAGEQCPILVGPSWQVQSWRTRWLSASPETIGSIGRHAKIPRVMTIMQLAHLQSSLTVAVANLHLDHTSDQARIAGIEVVLDQLREVSSERIIVMGDFNAEPDSAVYQMMLDAGFRDAHGPAAGGTFHAWRGDCGRRIDYLFVGGAIEVLGAHIDRTVIENRLPSDHWPIAARLRLRS